MAIQPIDLQALFTQVEKVGKAQSQQREGLALQQDLQNTQMQKRTEDNIRSVNETQNMGDGTEKVNDQKKQQQNSGDGKRKDGQEHASEQEETAVPVICDPRLGRNIDISL